MKTLATFLVLLKSNLANEKDADSYQSDLMAKGGKDGFIDRNDFVKVNQLN